jgi:hypothetical protein|tara:strand:- start:520 stop:1116 length:597 start_codon:yes stop_codon:yes gene_type:complete
MTPSFLKYFTAGLLILMFQSISAQDPLEKSLIQPVKEFNQDSKHFINAEIGGRTLKYGSLNYEYALHKRISLGCGIGLIYFQKGDITRNNNGNPETGKYRDLGTSQMIYGNYFIGKNKHQLHLTAGLTNFLFTVRNKYPSETESSSESQLEWNAGIGYQLSVKRIYLRLTGYCISLPEPTGWFPKYMPWIGISMGLKI